MKLGQLVAWLDRWTLQQLRFAVDRVRQVRDLPPTITLAPRTNGPRRCRACGCTDADRVCKRSGVPCFWVGDDCCSACAAEIM